MTTLPFSAVPVLADVVTPSDVAIGMAPRQARESTTLRVEPRKSANSDSRGSGNLSSGRDTRISAFPGGSLSRSEPDSLESISDSSGESRTMELPSEVPCDRFKEAISTCEIMRQANGARVAMVSMAANHAMTQSESSVHSEETSSQGSVWPIGKLSSGETDAGNPQVATAGCLHSAIKFYDESRSVSDRPTGTLSEEAEEQHHFTLFYPIPTVAIHADHRVVTFDTLEGRLHLKIKNADWSYFATRDWGLT